MSPRGRDIRGPGAVNLQEFDCLLQIPAASFTVVALHDAHWAHRGRWHLTGTLHGLPEDVEALAHTKLVQVIYNDRSSEEVHWLHSATDDATYRIDINHGRFSAYTDVTPRYPKGRSVERRVGLEVTNAEVPNLRDLLAQQIPGVDDQRMGWVIGAVIRWRDLEVVNATNQAARQLADILDHLNDLRRLITAEVDGWQGGAAPDDSFGRIERLLDLSEKGLPL